MHDKSEKTQLLPFNFYDDKFTIVKLLNPSNGKLIGFVGMIK